MSQSILTSAHAGVGYVPVSMRAHDFPAPSTPLRPGRTACIFAAGSPGA
jgi:hypothetical protein